MWWSHMASPCFASEIQRSNEITAHSRCHPPSPFLRPKWPALSTSTADSACVSRETQQEVAIIRSFHCARPSRPLSSSVPRNDWRTEAQHGTRMQQQHLCSGRVKRLQCLLPHPKCVRILKIHQQSSSPLNAEHYVNKLIPFHAVNIPSCV